MSNAKVSSESTSHNTKRTRVNLNDPAIMAQIGHVFNLIYQRSKENPKYSESFSKMMKPIGISSSTILKIKKVALERKIFIQKDSCNVRFRDDLASPNEMMIASLIEGSREKPKTKENPLSGFTEESLVKELRRRGFKVQCVKTVIVKL